MHLQIERHRGRIAAVNIGTRRPVSVGGDASLPYYHFESRAAHRPLIAIEVPERASSWPDALVKKAGSAAAAGPGAWARRAADGGAGLVCIRIAERESADESLALDALRAVEDVVCSVELPVMVAGTGRPDIDNAILPAIAERFKGENLALGSATQDNYAPLTRACIDHGHVIVAESPIDINICKQLNILISEAGLPLNRILIDPTTGGLGYGIEYTYSIMEKARLAALSGDRMLACPVVCFVGKETWKLKEASVSGPETVAWGDPGRRGTLWESVAASALLGAGAHIVVMRDVEAAAQVRTHIDTLWRQSQEKEEKQDDPSDGGQTQAGE
ncbi:MAG: acetyl-CoA decarbonylase/synthase complex subunit delta [Bacillota bacterium]|nr:acetyl-CoA decarbonylase/synthase complex subunit delta [Bacillota bacterium]